MTVLLALAAAIAVAIGVGLLRPVRTRAGALWRRAIGKPVSRLRFADPGPFQTYWGWYPDAKGLRRVVWQSVLLVTNDGDRVNGIVNGSIAPISRSLRTRGIKATFGPPLISAGKGADKPQPFRCV